MERCPLCKGFTVTYDAYHKKVRCMAPFCEYDKPITNKKENKSENKSELIKV